MSTDNEIVTCAFCKLESFWGGKEGDPTMWECEDCGEIFCGDCCLVDNENDERILCEICR